MEREQEERRRIQEGRKARLSQLEQIHKEVSSWPEWTHNTPIPYYAAFDRQYQDKSRDESYSQTSP